MSSVTTKWRQLKTNLITHYIFDKYEDKSLCGKYSIDEETWSQFVQSQTDLSWAALKLFSPKLVAIPSPNALLSHTLLSLSPLIDPSALPSNQTQTLLPHPPNPSPSPSPSNQFPNLSSQNPRRLNPRQNPHHHLPSRNPSACHWTRGERGRARTSETSRTRH
ncbi:hypothetical protein VNO80_25141 [Phaseolus coccineus]|uniref:Uncharacterized protein n=1 Tax=Phaseolus coccineus TaxID=3886 RepID=A0AAN9QNP4_PHACN